MQTTQFYEDYTGDRRSGRPEGPFLRTQESPRHKLPPPRVAVVTLTSMHDKTGIGKPLYDYDPLKWLYIGWENDHPKSWTFMGGGLAPGPAIGHSICANDWQQNYTTRMNWLPTVWRRSNGICAKVTSPARFRNGRPGG